MGIHESVVSIIHDPGLSPVPWELRGEVPPKREPLNSFPAADSSGCGLRLELCWTPLSWEMLCVGLPGGHSSLAFTLRLLSAAPDFTQV